MLLNLYQSQTTNLLHWKQNDSPLLLYQTTNNTQKMPYFRRTINLYLATFVLCCIFSLFFLVSPSSEHLPAEGDRQCSSITLALPFNKQSPPSDVCVLRHIQQKVSPYSLSAVLSFSILSSSIVCSAAQYKVGGGSGDRIVVSGTKDS